MLRCLLFLSLAASTAAFGWVGNSVKMPFATKLSYASSDQDSEQQNPCWGDLYDDDCAMSNVFAASFVAADWIRSMPCASGLEDCDMPDDLSVPDMRPEAGVEQVDVMGFLGLKRAKPMMASKGLKP
eukprot:CAMPEP_0198141484 /NCGR_PEP_ID=MMETSP1443-20131203/4489_1 /TAXON_ID=186043 /ORGANISM="Entomoneis sp., Strain CCMP2396" /LENGTH=126 /DNA_ID=CAMNT_0043804249 /DNA_START=58 /DNA_END=438 /DNA_ORIENTATION=-